MGADLSTPMFGLACNAPAGRRHVTPSSDAGPQRGSDVAPPWAATKLHAPLVIATGMFSWSVCGTPPDTPVSVPVLADLLNFQLSWSHPATAEGLQPLAPTQVVVPFLQDAVVCLPSLTPS